MDLGFESSSAIDASLSEPAALATLRLSLLDETSALRTALLLDVAVATATDESGALQPPARAPHCPGWTNLGSAADARIVPAAALASRQKRQRDTTCAADEQQGAGQELGVLLLPGSRGRASQAPTASNA
jgi:hypothetical protein